MTPATQPPHEASGLAERPHPAARRWGELVGHIDDRLRQRGVHPSRALVLVPYAQLMDAGRRAWARQHPDGFGPRFESSRNWAQTLLPFDAAATDLTGDMARDSLVAAHLLERVARGRADAALGPVLVARLVESARQLLPLAAAQPPHDRLAWSERLRDEGVATGAGALQWESLVASLALAWAGTSGCATDVLWSPQAAPGAEFDLLLVLQGHQPDPLANALLARWGGQAELLRWDEAPADPPAPGTLGLHACGDAEDEAQRAAACVIARLNAGQVPVALVANDRLLTRRIGALLQGEGVAVRDETGWKLSTTHAAGRLLSLLRSVHRRARTDDLLDLLKQTRAWPQAPFGRFERRARSLGVAQADAALRHPQLAPLVPPELVALLDGLRAARPLAQWLTDLAQALRTCGWWDDLTTDAAGQQLVQALRLGEGAAHELSALADGLAPAAAAAERLSLGAFTAWLRDALEAASFRAPGDGAAPVVVLPLAQLLGRGFAATVAPGCDELRLPPSPELPGQWTPPQREALGLPSREALADAGRRAWQTLLGLPQVDLLWRTQDGSEAVLPCAWVQALQAAWGAPVAAPDPRQPRELVARRTPRPTPSAGDLLPPALSASAYQDLRHCPYRFFALRQLRLQEADELENEPDKRDMGIWLHAVLKAFHEQRLADGPGSAAGDDRGLLDTLAQRVARDMGLAPGEAGTPAEAQGAGFLPFMAAWPALRDGYLAWLAGFEAAPGQAGPRFALAEQSLTREMGRHRLVGQLDRIDHQDSPEGVIPLVIDYKTEPRKTTLDRVRQPLEDTQLGFYAALMPDDTLRAAYLSISEQREGRGQDAPTLLVEQTQVIELREQLLAGLASDLDRIAAGHAMPALGEGPVCDFCAARGLCRKDFWT